VVKIVSFRDIRDKCSRAIGKKSNTNPPIRHDKPPRVANEEYGIETFTVVVSEVVGHT